MSSPAAHPSLGVKLIRWSSRRDRNLPWRRARDPYRVWISEIMLQQTQVETVIPYYRQFFKRFPRVRDLARAEMGSVLRAWEGLGYYARARNMHRAARRIAAGARGRFPGSAAEWEKLPGVGRYTAAAIASIASGEPAVALDANARRILARVHAYRRGIHDARAERDLGEYFLAARGASAPGAFFQALMDLGQLVCLPKRPRCAECPAASECESRKRGIQDRLPVRARAARIPHIDVAAAVIRRSGRVLLARRPEGKMLGGLWEFPGGKRERGETLPACLRRELREELGVDARVRERLMAVKHAFSHFRITLYVFACDRLRGRLRPIDAAEVRWVRIRDLRRYPMGRADRTVAERITGL
jgi:A/G-specific adenine glycosylase